MPETCAWLHVWSACMTKEYGSIAYCNRSSKILNSNFMNERYSNIKSNEVRRLQKTQLCVSEQINSLKSSRITYNYCVVLLQQIRYLVIAQQTTNLKTWKCRCAGPTGYLRRAAAMIKFRSLSTLSLLKFKKK